MDIVNIYNSLDFPERGMTSLTEQYCFPILTWNLEDEGLKSKDIRIAIGLIWAKSEDAMSYVKGMDL